MNTSLVTRIMITVLVFLCLLHPVHAHDSHFSGLWMSGVPLAYQDEGVLVKVPATAGDIAGGALGIAIGLPLGILLAPAGLENIVLAPRFGGYFFGMSGRLAGGTVAGAPFLVVQAVVREVSRAFAAQECRYRNLFKMPISA